MSIRMWLRRRHGEPLYRFLAVVGAIICFVSAAAALVFGLVGLVVSS